MRNISLQSLVNTFINIDNAKKIVITEKLFNEISSASWGKDIIFKDLKDLKQDERYFAKWWLAEVLWFTYQNEILEIGIKPLEKEED